MASNLAIDLPSPEVVAAPLTKRRNRPHSLPKIGERRSISLQINALVDERLEIVALLEKRMKNKVVFDSLQEFLDDKNSSCDAVQNSQSSDKVRVTFILTEAVDKKLTSFTERCRCTAASAVTAALASYVKAHYSFDLLKKPDPPRSLRDRVFQALHA